MDWKFICKIDEISENRFTIFELNKISMGIIVYQNIARAYLNICPHAGAAICEGIINDYKISTKVHHTELISEDSLILCPWHGYEFKIETGEAIVKDCKNLVVIRLKNENGNLFVYI